MVDTLFRKREAESKKSPRDAVPATLPSPGTVPVARQ
jgi:hypothetical protein